MDLGEKFHGIRHFTEDEFDRPDKIDIDALRLLDVMRHEEAKFRDIRIIINADYAKTGHSPTSRHGFGDAFDITIIDAKTREPLPITIQFLMASRYSWSGIGIYPFWKLPGVHVDRRPWTTFGRRSLWYRKEWIEIEDSEKTFRQKYCSIEEYFNSIQQIIQEVKQYHDQINS